MSEPYAVKPVTDPVRGFIRPPGSKSVSNRALIVAALAEGRSRITGLLDSTDTQVMLESLRRLGLSVQHDAGESSVEIDGCAGRIPASEAELWLENSGTSIRFLTAVCALGAGRFHLDGNERMRERPITDLAAALNQLGGNVTSDVGNDRPPLTVMAGRLKGGRASIGGNVSSQFLSALLMAAPCAESAVELHIEGELVSRPYVEMTLGVMEAFGMVIDCSAADCFRIEPGSYQSRGYEIEPDASAASYFFAAAAITGGEVTVEGLSRRSLQGDVRFVDVLERMGCAVEWGGNSITVRGGTLQGIGVDMNDISDTAQTLAAVALFADGPTAIENIAHVRHKETDRIAAVATELRRLGQTVDERGDGLTIYPQPIKPAIVETYDDHRMAMSFALIGLKADGIRIADPGCTAKTYPRFFEDLERLCGGAR